MERNREQEAQFVNSFNVFKNSTFFPRGGIQMLNKKRWAIFALVISLVAVALAACTPTTETVTVEVTRVVTETVVEEGETVEVTRIVTETVVETVEVEPEVVAGPKDLIVCMAQEPDTMYPYGGSMLAASAVQHAIYENNFTTLSYEYQAQWSGESS
jgi:peptide/nickel transport system substrate-binding protein